MYRDFSNASKDNLLRLINDVEDSKWTDATDRLGDVGLTLLSWSGKLRIKHYLNNVSSYHRKVIDKNNTTKSELYRIFDNVRRIDFEFKNKCSSVTQILETLDSYVLTLNEIVNPVNGLYFSNDKIESLNSIFTRYQTSVSELLSTTFEEDGFESFEKIDILERFLITRNETGDAILYGLSQPLTEGLKSIIKKPLGLDDFNDETYKDSIRKIIFSQVQKQVDLEKGKKTINITGEVVETIDGAADLKEYLKTSGLSVFEEMDDSLLGKFAEYLELGEAGLELAEIWLNDYSATVTAIKNMKEGLIAVGGDQRAIEYCDELIEEYNNKVSATLDLTMNKIVDKTIDEGVDSTLNLVTVGLWEVADFAHGLIWNVSGVEDKGEALGAVYASSHYSDDLIASYNYYADKLKSGNYTAHDIEMCKTMFELSKAAKIEELNNILMLTRDEFHEEIRDQIYTLEDMEWNTYNIDSIPNISQIDSDFCNVNSGGGRI